MTREIKFRGKRIDNKEWVYGYYVKRADGRNYIFNEGWYEIYPATVGQFTGLKGKNGKEIYEGDILRVPPKDNWDEANYASFEVFFHDGDMNADYNIGFSMNRTHYKGSICGAFVPPFKPTATKKMEIIGNIHDNPELLNQ